MFILGNYYFFDKCVRHRKFFTNKLYPLHLNFQGTFLLNDDYIQQKIYLITQLKVKLIRRNLMQAILC